MIRKVDYFISETNSLQSRLAEMEYGVLSVDATNGAGDHFAKILLHYYPSYFVRLVALKPDLDMIWRSLAQGGGTSWSFFVCSEAPSSEYLWGNLDIVEKWMRGKNETIFQPVFQKLAFRRWLASPRRAWLLAAVAS